ncbi:MAG: hypothetical protein HCTETUND2_085 [Candidatus Hodgkinia cicadicola]|nr:MAG: hypothetical protein HCTETUND2_085 [Candidatus Hodgkinia cicadicola]
MISEALSKSAKAAISMFNIDGICYAIKLLRVDKLMLCLRYGIIMLGAESAISKAVRLRLCSFRKVMLCLLNEHKLWLTRFLCFDYTYYLKTKVLSLRLLSAKRLLHVMSSSLSFCAICANLTLLISSVLCTRYHNACCCDSVRFVKKIMWKIGLSKLHSLKSKGVNAIMALFGVCLCLLNIKTNELLKKYSPLRVGASLQFITEACIALNLSARKLLFNVWSLRAFKSNAIQAFSSAWLYNKLWVMKCVLLLRGLGEYKLSRARIVFGSVVRRIENMLSSWSNVERVLLDSLGGWRVLMARLLSSIRAIELLDDVKMLIEWCNLLLMLCCSVLYCVTFYKILARAERAFFINAVLDMLNRLRANVLRLFSKEFRNVNTR